jgi:hypothetical protein
MRHEYAPGKLADLLETLPSEDRREITAWLLAGSRSGPPAPLWPSSQRQLARSRRHRPLPSGEETQLVTVRLPTEGHARLRDWCSENGFTMAAVVRGLVERFLDDQASKP